MTAPHAITSWRYGVPLELLRYAGANRLMVDIDYRAENGRWGHVVSSRTHCAEPAMGTGPSESGNLTSLDAGVRGGVGGEPQRRAGNRRCPAASSSTSPLAARARPCRQRRFGNRIRNIDVVMHTATAMPKSVH